LFYDGILYLRLYIVDLKLISVYLQATSSHVGGCDLIGEFTVRTEKKLTKNFCQ